MSSVEIETKVRIDIDVDVAAKWFAHQSDDTMCRFLVAVAAEAEKWPMGADNQWFYLGGHLRNCECSNETTREMLRSWVYWMGHSNHGEDGK